MNLQLYQTEDHTYLLDFQNLPTLQHGDESDTDDDQPTTHSLEFFELCSTFIAVRALASHHHRVPCVHAGAGPWLVWHVCDAMRHGNQMNASLAALVRWM